MRRLARGLVASDFDAEDVAQETWLALLKQASGADLSRGWLTTTLTNIVRKRHREACRRRRRERSVSRSEYETSSPEAAAERAELRRQLARAVLELGEPYRSTIVLRYFEDMKLHQIATSQGVSVNTVKTRVSRGLGRMRERLGPAYWSRRAWSLVLPPPPVTDAPCAAASPATSLHLQPLGILAMASSKGIASAVCLSAVLILALGLSLRDATRGEHQSSPPEALRSGAVDSRPRALAAAESPLPAPLAHAPGHDAREPAPETTAAPAAALRGEPAEVTAQPPSAPPVVRLSAEVAVMREAYARLRKEFGEGGGAGWKAVGASIAMTAEALLGSEEGFAEFLALIDNEEDGSFLEALMHHLPMAQTEARQAILDDYELHEAIWERYEGEEDPTRRIASLRFFAFNRRLNSSRMGAFLEAARNDPSANVRELAVDAIASNRDLIEETWETLAEVAESDPSPACRRTAMGGLALVQAERATSLVHAALSSPDEAMRAAAMRSRAGDALPETLTHGDPLSYLVNEFHTASDRSYKRALVERLRERSPETTAQELRLALPEEKDWLLKREYRATLEELSSAPPPGAQ
jgi:RNA polymerase sigma-70 factor (ECF subfamily)